MEKKTWYHVHWQSSDSEDLVGDFVARCPSLVAALDAARPVGFCGKIRRECDGLTFSTGELWEAVEIANAAKDNYESILNLSLSHLLHRRG